MPAHEHMEHAEHAEHAAHDPFDKRVALTIAIVAAILASVTVLAHRAHTDTLLRQGEGLAIQSEANSLSNESFDKWAEYQAKKNRQYADIKKRDSDQELWDTFKLLVASLGAEGKQKKAEKALDQIFGKSVKDLDKSIASAAKKVDNAMEEAKSYDKKSKDKGREALAKMHASHEMHERADRFDLAELFVEVALVLCSIAILTKRKSFWLTGMGICLLGAVIAVTGLMGLFMSPSHEGDHHDQHHEQKHDTHKSDKDHDHKQSKKSEGDPH